MTPNELLHSIANGQTHPVKFYFDRNCQEAGIELADMDAYFDFEIRADITRNQYRGDRVKGIAPYDEIEVGKVDIYRAEYNCEEMTLQPGLRKEVEAYLRDALEEYYGENGYDA